MAKGKTLQQSGATSPGDQVQGCRAIFKGLFSKQSTAGPSIPPVAPTLAVNPDKPLQTVPNQTLAAKQEQSEVNANPNDPPVSKETPSQSRIGKANAKFRDVKEQLQKVISKPNTVSAIQLSFLDSSEIGNLSQMARDIDLAILEFMKERDKQKELQKGKSIAKSWVHKFSFAGQRILGIATSAATEFFPSTACSLVSCTVGYLLKIAYEASGRAEAIDSTLETVSKAAENIQKIDLIPTHLALEQLSAVHCAALDLCTAMVSYLTILIKYINMGVLENTTKTVLQGEGSFKEGSDAISQAIENYRQELTLHLLTDIREAPRVKEFYEWLSPESEYTKHKAIGKELEFCAGGSVPEFLLSDEFRQWSQGLASNLLLCYGNPGAGKSFMSFLAIRYLGQSLRLHKSRRIAYFYFDYSVKKQSAVDVLASLLKQLASPLQTVPACLEGLYRNFQTVSDPRPDQAKLLDLLVEFAAAYPEVLIFLDAFDECDPTLRGHVISIVQRLHEANIKIWVTTQPGRIQDFVKDGLKDAVKAEIKAKKLDVMSYVTAKLISHDIDDNLRTEIIDTISSGVDGIFLLAKVQLDTVLEAEFPPYMRLQLEDLPKSPSESYMKGLQRIRAAKSPVKVHALHALSWVYHAKRKLKMEELLDALTCTTKTTAFDLKPSHLIDMCRGLVFHDESSDIVQFIHGTVETFLNQYFEAEEVDDTVVVKDLRPHFFGNIDLGKACLRYFSLDVFDNPCSDRDLVDERLQNHKFSVYAAHHWADHIRGVVETDGNVRVAISEAFGPAGKRESMQQIKNYPWRPVFPSVSLLHVLVENRIPWVSIYCPQDDKSNSKDSLVELVQQTSVNATDCEGITVLHYAVQAGQLEVVKFLVGMKADVNATNKVGTTALQYAARRRNLEIVKFLVEEKAHVNAPGKAGRTALHYSAEKGYLELTKFLVEEKADVNAPTRSGVTPLHYAARRGHLEVVRLLVEKKADVNAPNKSGMTPLHYAARDGRLPVVKFLIAENADIDAIDQDGETVLHHAAEGACVEVVEFLIAENADTKAKNKWGSTVLHSAAKGGYLEVVKFLVVEKSELISVKDNLGRTALDISKESLWKRDQRVSELLSRY